MTVRSKRVIILMFVAVIFFAALPLEKKIMRLTAKIRYDYSQHHAGYVEWTALAQKELLDALKNDDWARAEDLIDFAEIECKTYEFCNFESVITADTGKSLNLAIANGDAIMVERLIELGADLMAESALGNRWPGSPFVNAVTLKRPQFF